MHRVRLRLRKQEKKAKLAIEVFDGATHLSYFGALAIQEELPAKTSSLSPPVPVLIEKDPSSSSLTVATGIPSNPMGFFQSLPVSAVEALPLSGPRFLLPFLWPSFHQSGSMGNVTFKELFGNAEESPYDTESEIKVVKRFKLQYTDDEDQIKFIGPIYSNMEDDTVYRFEAAETKDDDTQSKHKEGFSKFDEEVADNDFVPRLVADAFEGRIYEFLSDTLKNILPQIIEDAFKHALPKFDEKVHATLKAHVPEIIIKPLNKELNALNTLESNRLDALQKKLLNTIEIKVRKFVQRNVRKKFSGVNELLKYCITQLDKSDVNLRELVDLIRDLIILIDSASASAKAAPDGENKSTQTDKESEIQVLTIAQGEQQPINITKPKNAKEAYVNAHLTKLLQSQIFCGLFFKGRTSSEEFEVHDARFHHSFTNARFYNPFTNSSELVNNSSKEASIRIIKDNQPLNLTINDKFVLKMLGFSEWLETRAEKLGIPPPPQLTAFGLTTSEKIRKRSAEILKEVFMKEDIVMDGMHMNLVPPQGVIGSEGRSSVSLTNTEDSLSSKHHRALKGLVECKASASNLRRIQVKDIVKEVKDYLKTYSSAGNVEGIH
ncbi:hypothetical protein Tco_0304160 [Tanacetum coccineum]